MVYKSSNPAPGEPATFVLADSDAIIEWVNKRYNIEADTHLTPELKAVEYAFERTFDSHWYFVAIHPRWTTPEGLAAMRENFVKPNVPGIAVDFVLNAIAKEMQKSLYHQGIGRHSKEVVYAMNKTIVDQVEAYLGDKKYFLSNETPSKIDAVLLPLALNVVYFDYSKDLKEAIGERPRLKAYADRLVKQYFPERAPQ
jgi:glutathione S-transferase